MHPAGPVISELIVARAHSIASELVNSEPSSCAKHSLVHLHFHSSTEAPNAVLWCQLAEAAPVVQ